MLGGALVLPEDYGALALRAEFALRRFLAGGEVGHGSYFRSTNAKH